MPQTFIGSSAIQHETASDGRLGPLIGSDPLFVAQVAKLRVMAGCDAGVLVIGETGTGKEVCAQAIHPSNRQGGLGCAKVVGQQRVATTMANCNALICITDDRACVRKENLP